MFLLVHKMDLVACGDRAPLLERRSRELQVESGAVPVIVFGTSIHDETRTGYAICRCFLSLSRTFLAFSPLYSVCLD